MDEQTFVLLANMAGLGLSSRIRHAARLHLVGEMTKAEAAREQGISRVAVGKAIDRINAQMKKISAFNELKQEVK